MDALIVHIEDDVTVLDATGKSGEEVVKYIEGVVQHSGMPVKYALVEVTKIDDWGPGDVADNLSEPDEMPTATLFELKELE